MTTTYSIKDSDISTENLVTKKIMSAIDSSSKGTWDFKEMDTVASGQALHGRLTLTREEVQAIADKLGESVKKDMPDGTVKYIRPLRNYKPAVLFLADLNEMSEQERASLRMKWEATNSNRRLNSLKLYKLHKGEKPKAPTKLEQITAALEKSIDTSTGKSLNTRTFLFQVSVAEILDHEYAKKVAKAFDNAEPKTTKKTTTKKTTKK